MSVTVIGDWANADTEAEADNDLTVYPDPCVIYTADTQKTFDYTVSGGMVARSSPLSILQDKANPSLVGTKPRH